MARDAQHGETTEAPRQQQTDELQSEPLRASARLRGTAANAAVSALTAGLPLYGVSPEDIRELSEMIGNAALAALTSSGSPALLRERAFELQGGAKANEIQVALPELREDAALGAAADTAANAVSEYAASMGVVAPWNMS